MAPPAIKLADPSMLPYASRDSSRHCFGSVKGHTRSYLRGSDVSIFCRCGGRDEDVGGVDDEDDMVLVGRRVRVG